MNPRRPQPLTAKEKAVLEFIEAYMREGGIAPSYQEIKDHFGFASFNSVQRYLKQLQKKNYIHIPGENQKRAITLLHSANAIQAQFHQSSHSFSLPSAIPPQPHFLAPSPRVKRTSPDFPPPAESFSLPLLGKVAAGRPLEAHEYNEFIDVPPSLIKDPNRCFALKVEGQSMIEDGIYDGDIIFVQQQSHAKNGDIVVATVDNEATVKRFYLHEKGLIELRPANSTMQSMWYTPGQINIQGVVVSLIRKF